MEPTTTHDASKVKGILTMPIPLFIVFSEYLGYVSAYIDAATDWCEGKKPSDAVASFLGVEAMCIYRDMIKTMTIDEIKDWYSFYYPLFMEDYDANLKKLDNPA